MIEIGMTVRDKVTGYQGLVTAITTYITGCDRALVTPRVLPDGKIESEWIDVPCLERVGKDRLLIDSDRYAGGGPNPPPRK